MRKQDIFCRLFLAPSERHFIENSGFRIRLQDSGFKIRNMNNLIENSGFKIIKKYSFLNLNIFDSILLFQMIPNEVKLCCRSTNIATKQHLLWLFTMNTKIVVLILFEIWR